MPNNAAALARFNSERDIPKATGLEKAWDKTRTTAGLDNASMCCRGGRACTGCA